MSTSTLLISIPIIAVIAALVRAFWLEILIIALVIRIIFGIAVTSFGSALVWAIGIENNKEEFWHWWGFFAILYTAAAIVIYLIALDIISETFRFIQKLFR